jgi:hypothetical protein
MAKLLTWLAVNGASVLGIVQAVLKFSKELVTALINLLSIVAPAHKAQALVLKARDIIEKIDSVVEAYKKYLIK